MNYLNTLRIYFSYGECSDTEAEHTTNKLTLHVTKKFSQINGSENIEMKNEQKAYLDS